MTDILLAVSVGCNLWFLFLLLYDRIMETRFVRFLKGIAGLWRSLDGMAAKQETVREASPAETSDIIGKSRFRMASTRTTAAIPTQEAATSEKGIELSEEEATFDDGNTETVSLDIVGQEAGESRNQVHRYIRLTELIPELLDMVDTGQIKFNPAVELSYLASEEQKDFLSAMDYAQAAPSLSQAQRIKKLAQEGECTLDAMCEIMNEIKKGELDRVTFKTDSLRKYFPKSYTNKQMEDKIIQLLEQWQKKREKSMER